jgi:hypothetical protein
MLASSGGHVPILVHWGVNRHTVDKSGGLSVIIFFFIVLACIERQIFERILKIDIIKVFRTLGCFSTPSIFIFIGLQA